MKYEITKGSEKDFELAPQWATLKERNTSGDLFFSEGHSVGCRVQGITTEHDFTIDDGNNDFNHLTLIAERRPITEPVWDGEGLPPVGVECEWKTYAESGWKRVKITAHGKEYLLVIIDGKESEEIMHKNNKFRPIRSPEDVARDEAIEAMRDVGYTLPAAIRFTKEEMAALYDAGYRRPKPHADEAQECEHTNTRPTSGGCICNDCGWTSW